MSEHPTTLPKILALPPGRYYYGDGLCLVAAVGKVHTNYGTKIGTNPRWIYRFTSPTTKRVTETSIGSIFNWTYGAARTEAMRLQFLVAKGQDPVQAKRQERAAQTTFGEACDRWIANHQSLWSESQKRNAELLLKKHGKVLLNKAVNSIDDDVVEQAIRPLWATAPKQARRTLEMWARVFGFAKKKKMRAGDNPATWKDNLDQVFPRPPKGGNHASLPYPELPDFFKRLRIRRGTSAAALEFCIITATRSSETREMVWSEIDFANRVWTIPAERTKRKDKEHRVPLSDRAIALLNQQRDWQKEYGGSQFVFQGRFGGTCMDDKSMRVLLQRDMAVPVTVHGFRATFKTWALEQTDYAEQLVELSLHHKLGNAVTRAYIRGDAVEKRREIMEKWASYCSGS
jgi:integrase